ncbi:response regulator [Paenibacillus sp. D51F]
MLLVDDKESVVQGMRRHIAWAQLGVQNVDTALDGKEAIGKHAAAPADLVITDIRMPNMSGIELMERLRGEERPIRFIVLSGYEEFEYARKAVALGASSYVLKPVDIRQLSELIADVLEDLRQEQREEEQKLKFQQTVKRSLPALRQQYLTEMMLFGSHDEHRLKEKWQFAELPLRASGFGLLVLTIDRFSDISKLPVAEIELARFIVENIIGDCLSEGIDGLPFYTEWGKLAVLVNCDPAKPEKEIKNELLVLAERCREAVHLHSKLTVSIGVSSACPELGNLPEAYRQASEAIEHTSFFGPNRIVHCEDVFPASKTWISYPAEAAGRLLSLVKKGQPEAVGEAADVFFASFRQEGWTPQAIRISCIQLLVDLQSSLTAIDWAEQGMERIASSWFDACQNMVLDDLQLHIQKWIQQLTEQNGASMRAGSRSIADLAKAIIEERLLMPLSLREVAEEADVSPNYLSSVFKKDTGVSFVEYVTDRKISKAKEWLDNPNQPVSEIAERLGYFDKKYFREMFKRKTGMTPSEYRDRLAAPNGGQV